MNIVLNKTFLNVFKFFSKKSLNDLIIIFDEAHNLERVARKVYDKHISERRLEFGLGELGHILDEIKEWKNDLLNNSNLTQEDVEEAIQRRYSMDEEQIKSLQSFIECILVAMRSIKIDETIIKSATENYNPNIQIADPKKPYDDRKDEFKKELLRTVGGNEKFVRESMSKLYAFGQWLDERLSEEDENELKSSCTIISGSLYEYIEEIPKKNGYYPHMSIRKNKNKYGKIIRQINIHLSLPEIITAPVIMEMYGGILMSATLEPFDVLKQVLGIGRETVERTEGLRFPLKNRRTYIVGRDKELDVGWDRIKYRYVPDMLVAQNDTNPVSEKYQQNTVEYIIDGSNRSVLIFFKNKQEARKYYNLLKNKYNGRILLNDSSNNSGNIKDEFYLMGDRGQKPIMCTYIGGSLAEGVDFRDDRARAVVIVGIGYTSSDMLTNADITAYNVKFGGNIGWTYVVQVPTIRKIRQAMGRVIRSDTDYGVRIGLVIK